LPIPRIFGTEGDVLQHGPPGKQRERLEHHAAIAPRSVHRLSADEDFAAGDRDEARDHVEDGRLAAARGPTIETNSARRHLQRDVVHRR
jgi:hypothetical protein